MSKPEADIIIRYNPATDGEQLSLLGENPTVTDDAILSDEELSSGLTLASEAAYGVRLMAGQHPVMDFEIFTERLSAELEVYPLDGRDKPATVALEGNHTDTAICGAVRAVMVARAMGQIES